MDYTLEKHNLDSFLVPGWFKMSLYAAWRSTYLLGIEEPVFDGTDRRPEALQPARRDCFFQGCMAGSGKPYGLEFVAKRFDNEKVAECIALYARMFPPPRLLSDKLARTKKQYSYCRMNPPPLSLNDPSPASRSSRSR